MNNNSEYLQFLYDHELYRTERFFCYNSVITVCCDSNSVTQLLTQVLCFVAASRCDESDCHGLLRPNVVFFGETLDSHVLTKVEKEMEICDLCLVVSYLHFYTVCIHPLMYCKCYYRKQYFSLSKTRPDALISVSLPSVCLSTGGHIFNRLPSSHVWSQSSIQRCPGCRVQHTRDPEIRILHVSQSTEPMLKREKWHEI